VSGLSAVVLFPNLREVACASLGFLKAYEVMRRRVAVADLSFVPSGPRDPVLSPKQGFLLGETSRRQVSSFDIVGFSVSYENDYVNIPGLLMKAGLEPLAAERPRLFPLVLGGGFTMSTNPLPIADFIDAVVVGEIEPVADSLLEVVERAKRSGTDKAGLLARLGALPGIYVPALGEKPVKRIWSDTDRIAPEPEVQARSHFGEMFLVEVGRGCKRGCHYCAAGNLYRPLRFRSGDSVVALAGEAPVVGLVGTAVGDHPDLGRMIESLITAGKRIGISSLRPDQVGPDLAAQLVRGGIKTIAIAPEAGTEALRRRIGKPIKDSRVERAVELLSGAGVSTVKLYFMVGLPGEADGDVEAIVDLVAKLGRRRGRARLSIAAGPFIPKPNTVFQWAPFAERRTLKRRMGILRKVRLIKGCSLKIQSVDEAWVEAVLSRGGRPLSRTILEAARKPISLKSLLRRSDLADPTLELDTAKPLPWDFIDTGVDREGLRRKYLEFKAN
jgi:radical SAM superfamily enzyme YgiQ (UPF0313 family)